MKKIFVLCVILVFAWLMLPTNSGAIPAFARKYGFNCNMCHTAFTKLNDFGQRFRDTGYQVPGQQGKESNVFDTPPPIAMRLSTGLSFYDNRKDNTLGFNLFGFDFLAAGVLHKNISFLLIYTPRIDEPASDYTGDNSAQMAGLESVSLIFSNVIQDALNIRIGRFEPAYHAFSSKRNYYLFEPFEIYNFTAPHNNYVFDDNQIGIEATGHFRSGFKYGLGILNGTGANPDNNKRKDIYANLFQTFGKGDGQSAGQRIGMFGYYGSQPTIIPPGSIVASTGETNGMANKPFYRAGVSGSFNLKTFNLQALYMRGMDDKAFNYNAQNKKYEYSGGFAQLDYAGLFNNRMVTSMLFNWISPPSSDSNNKINAYSALVRYYLGDWTAVNVSIHAEYTHKRAGKTNPSKENLFALALDFAF